MTNKNRWWLASLIFCCSLSCNKIDLDEIQNLNGNRIEVIGHGGGGFQSPNNPYPSNSKASILQAIENYNVDGVEVDVQISGDSILWLYHDQSLSSQTDCQGCVIDMKSADLENCKFQTDFDVNIFMNEKLVTLEYLLQLAVERNIPPTIFLDIKEPDFCSSSILVDSLLNGMFAQKLIDMIKKYEAESWVIIESGDRNFIQQVKEKDPSILLNYLIYSSEDNLQFAIANNIFGITINNDTANKEVVNRAHNAGLRVVLYNTKVRGAHISAVEKNPDYIVTDNILLLQEILR